MEELRDDKLGRTIAKFQAIVRWYTVTKARISLSICVSIYLSACLLAGLRRALDADERLHDPAKECALVGGHAHLGLVPGL